VAALRIRHVARIRLTRHNWRAHIAHCRFPPRNNVIFVWNSTGNPSGDTTTTTTSAKTMHSMAVNINCIHRPPSFGMVHGVCDGMVCYGIWHGDLLLSTTKAAESRSLGAPSPVTEMETQWKTKYSHTISPRLWPYEIYIYDLALRPPSKSKSVYMCVNFYGPCGELQAIFGPSRHFGCHVRCPSSILLSVIRVKSISVWRGGQIGSHDYRFRVPPPTYISLTHHIHYLVIN